MKIRQKIISGYMAIVLLMCIVGYFSVYVSKKILIKTIREYTVAMAHTALDKIDRAIQRRSEQVEAYTENLPFKEMFTQSNEEFDRLDRDSKGAGRDNWFNKFNKIFLLTQTLR
jgi:CHASE3 domain sensor protein